MSSDDQESLMQERAKLLKRLREIDAELVDVRKQVNISLAPADEYAYERARLDRAAEWYTQGNTRRTKFIRDRLTLGFDDLMQEMLIRPIPPNMPLNIKPYNVPPPKPGKPPKYGQISLLMSQIERDKLQHLAGVWADGTLSTFVKMAYTGELAKLYKERHRLSANGKEENEVG